MYTSRLCRLDFRYFCGLPEIVFYYIIFFREEFITVYDYQSVSRTYTICVHVLRESMKTAVYILNLERVDLCRLC